MLRVIAHFLPHFLRASNKLLLAQLGFFLLGEGKKIHFKDRLIHSTVFAEYLPCFRYWSMVSRTVGWVEERGAQNERMETSL